jgi:sporulation protein YlmC with PRC-barrel domain
VALPTVDPLHPENEVKPMLRSLNKLDRYKVTASDGDIGTVENFLIDDARWTVRYLVVETDGFLDGRQVLITPISFRKVDYAAQRFLLTISKDKVTNSPGLSTDLPVSQQYERDYYGYYGYPYYGGYGGLWGVGGYPSALAAGSYEPESERLRAPPLDVHLRSARQLNGYHIEATDGSIGHVKDFVVDDETWQVRYLIIATNNWWPGKSVLVAPEWATKVSWADRQIHVGMTREAIKSSPEWNVMYPINAEYEESLNRHYSGIPGWSSRDRGFPRSVASPAAPPRT